MKGYFIWGKAETLILITKIQQGVLLEKSWKGAVSEFFPRMYKGEEEVMTERCYFCLGGAAFMT